MFKIEKGIAIPDTRTKYPFAEMEIGDSFLVPGTKGIKALPKKKVAECSKAELRGKREYSRVTSAIEMFKRSHRDMNFSVRTTDQGLRVWRTEQSTDLPETNNGDPIQ